MSFGSITVQTTTQRPSSIARWMPCAVISRTLGNQSDPSASYTRSGILSMRPSNFGATDFDESSPTSSGELGSWVRNDVAFQEPAFGTPPRVSSRNCAIAFLFQGLHFVFSQPSLPRDVYALRTRSSNLDRTSNPTSNEHSGILFVKPDRTNHSISEREYFLTALGLEIVSHKVN